MEYYVNKYQFMNPNFIKKLEFYNSIGVSIKEEVLDIYNINAQVASGNYSNLHQTKSKLKSLQNDGENYQTKIRTSKENVINYQKELKIAKDEWWNTFFFSPEEKAAIEKIRASKKNLTDAENTLKKDNYSYQEYLASIKDAKGEQKESEDIIADCIAKNKQIEAVVQPQIVLVTEFRAKMEAFKKTGIMNQTVVNKNVKTRKR